MRIPIVLIAGLMVAGAVGAVPGLNPEEKLEEIAWTCEDRENGELFCTAPGNPGDKNEMGAQAVHQFSSVPGNVCQGRPATPLNVCASGSATMTFASGCGTPPPGQVCLQLSGSASGSATLRTGVVTAGLTHMYANPCSWSTAAGGSCSTTFRDPTTHATVHKAWHNMVNTWQCHYGSTTTKASVGGTTETVVANFQTCYRYA